MHSLWGLRDLDREQLQQLLEPLPEGAQVLKPARLAMLMQEDSTRTWGSFIVAAQEIGADHLHLTPDRSSMSKGESVLDTFRNLSWMGVGAFVLRTSENGLPQKLSDAGFSVINAGDGTNEHPTQGLLDARTMLDHFGDLVGLRVLIAGDIARSRVARSNSYCLTKLGAEVLFAGPAKHHHPEGGRTVVFREGVPQADVIMMLRWQKERSRGNPLLAAESRLLEHEYALTEEVLSTAQHRTAPHDGDAPGADQLRGRGHRGNRSRPPVSGRQAGSRRCRCPEAGPL